MIKRVIYDILLLLVIFIFPWKISIILMFIGLFAFNNFYEFIISSVIIYSLYSIPSERIISSPIFFPLIVIVVYSITQYIKSNIILYKK
jgi:hypothetical protein